MRCHICNKRFKTTRDLSNHLRFSEHIKVKDYYDKYLKAQKEGICSICKKPTHFISLSEGYNKYCSYICMNNDKKKQKKQQNTTMSHYGVKHPAQNKKVLQKMQNTCIERYGVSNGHGEKQKEQIKQKSLEKYGTENPFQSEEVKEKIRKTRKTKYGNENYTNREKAKRTIKRRYGVDNISQIKTTKKKVKQTKLYKYGKATYNNIEKAKKTLRKDVDNYCKQYNLVRAKDLISQYGNGWYNNKIVDIIKYKNTRLVHKEDISIIKQYALDKEKYNTSARERQIVSIIKSVYKGGLIRNSHSIISPQEIDIYLPDIKLAVEYNGTYWHSDWNKPKDYHLNKSLRCRELGIRLIHIYDFEDFSIQKQLLIDLINGTDNYPKKDFNKNNLNKYIPKPRVIYKKGDLILYGAGKLY